MPETTKQPSVDPVPEQRQGNGSEKLFGSGFEDELPEADFDERI
jgi:hypothetical protein